MAGSSKRVRYGDKDFEETVLRWFDEVESDFSDVNSISDDECINSDYESDSTLSEISDESEKEAKQNDENLKHPKCFYGKNRYRWSVRVYTDIETQKPEIIAYYNQNKGGVDSLDEKCAKHSSSRRTRRWPLAVFFRILDVSVVNSYILHQCYKENLEIKEKSVFAKSLASSLVWDHMERRLQFPQLPRELRFVIARILQISAENTPQVGDLLLQKRKACFLCQRTSHRMTKYLCVQCRKPVCLQRSKPTCNDCIKNAII